MTRKFLFVLSLADMGFGNEIIVAFLEGLHGLGEIT